jgi:hypothetical protein
LGKAAKTSIPEHERGPAGYENWRVSCLGGLPSEVVELQLYSDAHLTGQVTTECGPYAVFNAIPFDAMGHLFHALTLRVEFWGAAERPDLSVTDMTRYHGGWLADELSALMSLLMGVRLKSGGISRRFDAGDSIGNPYADTQAPMSPLPPRQRRWIIPHARETRNLNSTLLPHLARYTLLSPSEAITLVRAARLYQDALWIAEAEPEMAWLLLVSAVEVVATHVQVAANSASDTFMLALPGLHDLLLQVGGQDLVRQSAAHLERHLRATARFLAFFAAYQASPPPRPSGKKVFEMDWELPKLKKSLSKVYDHRSRALHDGTPFPAPMCEGPDQAGFFCERPLGLASGTNEAAWLAADTPMLLHVFEHLARTTIIQWWQQRAQEGERLAMNACAL